MGEIKQARRVTPICGVIYRDGRVLENSWWELEKLMGEVVLESEEYPFDLTQYYFEQMGGPLKRRFIAFEGPSDPAELATWKLATNSLEERLTKAYAEEMGVARPINLDPGYITGAKLVLATTKDFAHRLYLRDGIYAEVTLSYRDGRWLSHEYTFPDFRDSRYHAFFNKVREHHCRHN